MYMTVQMIDKPNTTPIGQDKETLTFMQSFALFVEVSLRSVDCFAW